MSLANPPAAAEQATRTDSKERLSRGSVRCQMSICAKCRVEIDEPPSLPASDRKPCPKCGSTGRYLEIFCQDELKLEDHLSRRFKHKDPSLTGKEKIRLDEIIGEELNQGTGKFVQKEWWIDRDRTPPWYYEKITDLETGDVIRFCSEPLDEHINRGSARNKST